MRTRLFATTFAVAAFVSLGTAYASRPETEQVEETEQADLTDAREEYIKFGNFDQWLVRNVKESGIIGGNTKTLYEIAPNGTWNNSNPYRNQGGSPWATSNVLAKVAGITKTNTSVYREARPGHGFCAKLSTH